MAHKHKYEWDHFCGAQICYECNHHRSISGDDLARCYCGWAESGGDGRQELVEMGEQIDEDY
jgi:hypothetical protein